MDIEFHIHLDYTPMGRKRGVQGSGMMKKTVNEINFCNACGYCYIEFYKQDEKELAAIAYKYSHPLKSSKLGLSPSVRFVLVLQWLNSNGQENACTVGLEDTVHRQIVHTRWKNRPTYLLIFFCF